MATDKLMHPVVKAAIEAMSHSDSEAWFALFSKDVSLTDDGESCELVEWSNTELFSDEKGFIQGVERVEDKGLTVYARFHSAQWGTFPTFWKFEIRNGKISRLDVGMVDG
ncbi:MAG: hypothetical protein R3C61_17020 [Bacteroidia bacterium]